jgi:hypothetical protein
MSLITVMENWDSKSAPAIKAIYDEYCQSPDTSAVLIDCLNNPKLQRAASWLVKYHIEQGNALPATLLAALDKQIPFAQDWQTRLHILQILPTLPMKALNKITLERFLRVCLADEHKFVRAWAYSNFYLFAQVHEELKDEANDFIRLAMQDETSSVKARIRQVCNVDKI